MKYDGQTIPKDTGAVLCTASYPCAYVVQRDYSTREFIPHAGRFRTIESPLKFEAAFTRSENAPRLTARFATEEEGRLWLSKMVRENWTTCRTVDKDGTRISWGRERYSHDGKETYWEACDPLRRWEGHATTGKWSPATWEAVHKAQKEYVKETAAAWKAVSASVKVNSKTSGSVSCSPRLVEDLADLHKVARKRRDTKLQGVAT